MLCIHDGCVGVGTIQLAEEELLENYQLVLLDSLLSFFSRYLLVQIGMVRLSGRKLPFETESNFNGSSQVNLAHVE